MGNTYTQNTLVFDHVHRRDARSEGIENYSERLLSSHESYTSNIAQSMEAKVEIIYGEKLREGMLQTQKFEILPLWEDFEGAVLLLDLLDFECCSGNEDS